MKYKQYAITWAANVTGVQMDVGGKNRGNDPFLVCCTILGSVSFQATSLLLLVI